MHCVSALPDRRFVIMYFIFLKVRTAQLKLMQLYLQTSDYMEHQHRFHELNECLRRIQTEEEDTGDDKHIVDFILTQIPAFILPSDDDGE